VTLESFALFFFFSSRRRHTRWPRDWSSDVCSSDLQSLRPAPLTSLLSLVLCVPARNPRRYHREASCRRCGFTFAPKTVSASSTWPTFLPSRLTTSTTGISLVLLAISNPSTSRSCPYG